MNYDLSTLNKEQLQPVYDTEGAVLVTAGAGSGKTRVLTHRIAYLIKERRVKPYNILAITFTNKAANEIKERLMSMVGPEAKSVHGYTFHGVSLRILRRFGEKIGLNRGFSIYDESDKERIIKKIIKEMTISVDFAKSYDAISKAKSQGISPEEYLTMDGSDDDIYAVYKRYEDELKRCQAIDFDDILIKAVKLLSSFWDVKEFYQEKFRYIHVDEFQDTNEVQYQFLRLLSEKHKNVFVVGDEDQGIYSWRGANIKIVGRYITDYQCKVYKLEQNYRSTKSIIQLANRIISNNKERIEKVLWTDNVVGEKVVCYGARSDGDEADFVVRTMNSLIRTGKYRLSDFAILMRINALSRSFEERFIQYAVPHKVYGGFKFYDRKEIKDVLAYLKIMGNHNDAEAIQRIINFPKRGIGDGTVKQLLNYSLVTGKSLYDVIIGIESNDDFTNALIKKVKPFSDVLQCMDAAVKQSDSPYELIKYIIRLIGLKEYYAEDTEENESRKSNIRELISSVKQFEEANEGATLDDYLQQISLYSDLDEMTEDNDSVSIATVHSAKGLEFKVVFLVGLEEGIFPDSRRAESEIEMEEERRLMYVAVTRAMERLYLTYANSRFRFGQRKDCLPSPFLQEAGFAVRREVQPPERTYGGYGGGYSSAYRGARAYSSMGDAYNREEVPDYAPSVHGGGSAPRSTTPPKMAEATKAVKKDISLFTPGTKVRHKKFGEGVIVSLDAAAEPSVTVNFATVGNLKLILNYAPIERID